LAVVNQMPDIMTVGAKAVNKLKRRHFIAFACWSWAIGVASWELAGGLIQRSNQSEVIALAAALASLGLIGAVAMSGDSDLRTALAQLKLGPWMGIGFSLGFGVSTLVWLGHVTGYHGIITSSALPSAGVIAGLGFGALVLAYLLTPQWVTAWAAKADQKLRGNGPLVLGAASVWLLWMVSMAGVVLSFIRGNLGYLADPSAALSTTSSANAALATLTQFGVLATLLAAWRFGVDNRPTSFLLMSWVAGSGIAIGLFSGQKEPAIVHLVAVVVGYSANRKLRLRPLAAAAVIVAFVITPFVAAYRPAVQTGSGRLSPIEAVQTVNFGQLLRGPTSAFSRNGRLGDSIDRWSRIGDLAIIVEQTPSSIGYISPVELLSGPVLGFIPRSVWRNKPVLDAGYQVNQQYYRAPSSIHSSAAVTPYGDLFRRGGVGIVILGMAILGMFVRAVDGRGNLTRDIDPRLLFLPVLLFTALVKQEIDFFALSASLVSTILAAAIAARLVTLTKSGGPLFYDRWSRMAVNRTS
jgi:hypothetical protein